jgi:hypothetical protein
MTTIQTKTWTGRNGQTRQYVQNLGDIAEDMYPYDLGRRNYDRAQGSKVWIDEAGEVHVDSWGLSFSGCREADLVAYIKGHLRKDEAPAASQVVESPLYGRGIRYADQPGATQYRGMSGRYDVQIWDEA